MKIRTDFVTNSSSSSFICDLCSRSESGYDITLDDAEMYECENGHVICEVEALPFPTDKKEIIHAIMVNGYNNNCWIAEKREYGNYTEEMLLMLEEDELIDEFLIPERINLPAQYCPICQFLEYTESDIHHYLSKTYGLTCIEILPELQKIDNKKTHLTSLDYITYVCNKFNTSPTEILKHWRDTFNSYADLNKYLGRQ